MNSSTYPTSWNLSLLLGSDQHLVVAREQKQIAKKTQAFVKAWYSRQDYLTAPEILAHALQAYENWMAHYAQGGAGSYYLWLRSQQDQGDSQVKARLNQLELQATHDWNKMQFFELNLAKISPKTQVRFLTSPLLKRYHYFLKRLFDQAQYLLSEPEERILNLKAMPAHSQWERMVSTFLAKEVRPVRDAKGNKKLTVFSDILGLMQDPHKPLRDEAAKVFNRILAAHADVAEQEINAILQNKMIDDQLRKLPRPDTGRHLSDDLDTKVVDTLIDTVHRRFAIAHRYYRLKAKLLGVKKLAYHERNVDMGQTAITYPFPKTIEIIANTFKALDPEFESILRGYLDQGQVDAFAKKGKVGGAFCAHHLPHLPTYILLNHSNRLTDVTTFAHELGHGINNELVKRSQPPLYFGTPMSTAEVASTFMEDFVLEALLKDLGPQDRLGILMEKLNTDISTIMRQVAFYQFEQTLHTQFRAQGYLDKAAIGRLFQTYTRAYMGPAVEQSVGSENWWIYVSHFRRFFYVYSYASGLLISKSLQRMVRQNPASITQVKTFLSTGLSDSPANIFGKLGIDITQAAFWDQGLDVVEDLLEQTEVLARKV